MKTIQESKLSAISVSFPAHLKLIHGLLAAREKIFFPADVWENIIQERKLK